MTCSTVADPLLFGPTARLGHSENIFPCLRSILGRLSLAERPTYSHPVMGAGSLDMLAAAKDTYPRTDLGGPAGSFGIEVPLQLVHLFVTDAPYRPFWRVIQQAVTSRPLGHRSANPV